MHPSITREEAAAAQIYFDLLGRYENLNNMKRAAPYMAVRLLAMRGGLDYLLNATKHIEIEKISRACIRELEQMHAFLQHITAKIPPPSDQEQDVLQDIEELLAAIGSTQVSEKITAYLTRLRIREDVLSNAKKARKENGQQS